MDGIRAVASLDNKLSAGGCVDLDQDAKKRRPESGFPRQAAVIWSPAIEIARRHKVCFARRNSSRLDSAPPGNTLPVTSKGPRERRHEIRYLLCASIAAA